MENTFMKKICKELKDNKDIYKNVETKILIKKLPFLIRTNGLINVLEYLNKDKEYCKKLKKFLLGTLGYNKRKTYDLGTDEYMFASKQAYDLFVNLRNMYKEIIDKKEEHKNETIKNDYVKDNITYKRNKDCKNTNFKLKYNKYLSIIDNIRKNNKGRGSYKYKINYYKNYDCYLNKDRINKAKECYANMGYKPCEIIINTTKRMIIGLGEPSVLETSIKLDHIYGVPYIPASTLKGALRDIAEEKIQECKEKNIKEIDRLFGTENNIGELIFLDAYPVEELYLELDIINQHYSDYYRDTSNEKAPTDDIKPNIINFLTVKSGTKFKIVVFEKDDFSINVNEDQYDLKKLFKEIGESKGIGAKSSVDYGYFQVENSHK